MRRTPLPCLTLARLVRRAEARRVAAAALSLAAAGPALAQGPVPQGGEFRVNTFTADQQRNPSVAVDADGDFVVAWESRFQDGSQYGVYAQRYAASGAPVGAEFQANTYTTSGQRDPSVAVDTDGDYVVAWGSNGQDGSSYGVYAQRYAASGAAVGGEFRVNTYTAEGQFSPSVAMDADGDFVVAWTSFLQDGSGYGVFAQRYGASGAPAGGEFRVNTYTTIGQRNPSVAMDADGDFVVAWGSYGQDGSYEGVYARRYAASGAPVSGEFRVNTFTADQQRNPSVATDADGDFVVAWESRFQGGSQYGVYAQRYAASGAAVGGEFRVNTFTTNLQYTPSVAMDVDGDFVVAWTSPNLDGSSVGVYARRYAASGAPVGGEFRANTYTTSGQSGPSVAVDTDGDFVVAWASAGQDGDRYGVYAQRYAAGPVASEPGTAAGLGLALVPSPVGPSGGRVRYETPEPGRVRVTVSDVLGREVAVLVDGEQSAGPHSVALDAGRLAPGVYVVRLEAGAATVVRRVTVAR